MLIFNLVLWLLVITSLTTFFYYNKKYDELENKTKNSEDEIVSMVRYDKICDKSLIVVIVSIVTLLFVGISRFIMSVIDLLF